MPTPPSRPRLFGSPEARRLAWLLGALLALATLALNARVAGYGFLYLRDDDVNLALNPHMGAPTAARIAWMFSDWSYARRYIPLGWLNLSATYALAGLDPRTYHVAGLALYILNSGLVLAVILHAVRLFGSPGGLGLWEVAAAALAAGWWTMSPLRVETTAWVSGNLYGQATALALLSAASYLRSGFSEGGRRLAWVALSAGCYLASLLSYPIALGMPVLLAALDIIVSRRAGRPPLRRLLAEKLVFLVPLGAVAYATVAARLQGAAVYGEVPGLRDFPMGARLAQSAYVAAYYLWKPFWPTHLSPLYGTLVGFDPLGPASLAGLALVGGVTLFVLARLRRSPAPALLWLGYLACAAPFFGLTEARHMASDRYACLLTVLTACLLALAAIRARAGRARALVVAGALAVLGTLGAWTSGQLEHWRDDLVLHRYVLGGLDNAELREDFSGRLLILEFMRGDEAAASAAVDAGLREHPASASFRRARGIMDSKRRIAAYYGPVCLLAVLQEHLGIDMARSGQLAEAVDHFSDALRMDDRFYQAAFDRALALLRLGRAREALGSYLEADRWAGAKLPADKRRGFLSGLRDLAREGADPGLEAAADRALARPAF